MSDSVVIENESANEEVKLSSEDLTDEGGAPVSRGDEGILEGVSIGETFEEGNSSGSDEEEEGIVIHAGRATSRRPIYKSFGLKSQRNQLSTSKEVTGMTKKSGEDDELKKLRFVRHVTAFDVDINSLDEHPWRNKNVDLLDYFNYGFGESSWMEYCERQLRIRAGKGLGPHQPVKAVVPSSVVQPVPSQSNMASPAATGTLAPIVTKVQPLSTLTQYVEAQSEVQLKPPAAFNPHQSGLQGTSSAFPAFQHMMPNVAIHPSGFSSHTESGWAQSSGMPPPRMQQHPHMGPGSGHQEMWGREFQQQSSRGEVHHQHTFPQHQQPPIHESFRSERATISYSKPIDPSSKPHSRRDSRDREDSVRSIDRGRGRDDKGVESGSKSKESSSSSRREGSSSDHRRSGERDRLENDRRSVRVDRPSDKKDESRDSGGRRESKGSSSGTLSSSSSSKRRHSTESRSRSRDRKRVERDPAEERRRK